MNCQTIQRHLLAQEDPGRPSPNAEAHLEQCALCRDWLHRLLQMERNVRLLPVPVCPVPAELKERIRTGKKSVAETTAARPFWRRHASAAGLAASVALLAACAVILLWNPWLQPTPLSSPPPPDPLLTKLMQCDVRLARADTPLIRITTLADLADDLQGEVASLAAVGAAADLKALAGWYEQVVKKGIVPQGSVLPTTQRQTILEGIIARLRRTDRDARQLAQEYPSCAEPLLSLATSAWEGHKRLQLQISQVPQPVAPTALAALASRRMSPVLAMAGYWPLAAAKASPGATVRGTGKAAPAAPPPLVVDQARRFQRNRELIESLVNGGLRMVDKTSPSDLAQICTDVAERLAGEIDQAVQKGEAGRAAELARYYHELLKTGLAENLRLACLIIPVDSPINRQLLELGRRIVRATQPLETGLQGATGSRALFQQALKEIIAGQTAVERALQGRGSLYEEE